MRCLFVCFIYILGSGNYSLSLSGSNFFMHNAIMLDLRLQSHIMSYNHLHDVQHVRYDSLKNGNPGCIMTIIMLAVSCNLLGFHIQCYMDIRHGDKVCTYIYYTARETFEKFDIVTTIFRISIQTICKYSNIDITNLFAIGSN